MLSDMDFIMEERDQLKAEINELRRKVGELERQQGSEGVVINVPDKEIIGHVLSCVRQKLRKDEKGMERGHTNEGVFRRVEHGKIAKRWLRSLINRQQGSERVTQENRPCGCVTCICKDEDQCHGCGAKACSDYPNCRPEPQQGSEGEYEELTDIATMLRNGNSTRETLAQFIDEWVAERQQGSEGFSLDDYPAVVMEKKKHG